jgi:hypothetical protein
MGGRPLSEAGMRSVWSVSRSVTSVLKARRALPERQGEVLCLNSAHLGVGHSPAGELPFSVEPVLQPGEARLHVLDALLQGANKDLVFQARADDRLDQVGEVRDPLERVVEGVVVDVLVKGFELVGENQVVRNF